VSIKWIIAALKLLAVAQIHTISELIPQYSLKNKQLQLG
jgi:hypothetical protein